MAAEAGAKVKSNFKKNLSNKSPQKVNEVKSGLKNAAQRRVEAQQRQTLMASKAGTQKPGGMFSPKGS